MDEVLESEDNAKQGKEESAIFSVLRTLADAQTKDTEIKKLELDVRSQEISSNERIAFKSIEAQERSHSNFNQRFKEHLSHRYIFIVIITVISCVFTIAMIQCGAKDILVDLSKILVGGVAGAFGGYHAGKNKKDSDE